MSATTEVGPHERPAVDETNEEYMLERVPQKARRSWWSQFVIWVGFGYVPTGLIVGGQLAGSADGGGMPFGDAMLTVVIGQGVLLLLTFALGFAAMKTGLNLSLISRFSYGTRGMILPMIIMGLLTLGWFASIVGMVGDIFNAAFGSFTGITIFNGLSLEFVIFSLIWGAIFTWSAWKGIVALERISAPAAPFVLIVAIIAAVMMTSEFGGFGNVLAEGATRSGTSIGTGVTLIIGAWIAGVIMGVDIFRFAKTAAHVFIGAGACFILTNPLLNIVGYTGSIATGDANFISWMVTKGIVFAILGVILWVVALWTTNMSELYCNALYIGPAINAMGAKVSRTKIVIIVGAIGSILGAFGFYSFFFADFITVLGAAFVPLAGPILADFFVVRRREYTTANVDELPKVRWPGIVSFLVGAVLGIVFQYWVPLPGDFPAGLGALIITFAVHIVLSKLMAGRPEQKLIESADAGMR